MGAVIVAAALLAATSQDTQTADGDHKAIRRAALNYVEGWYTADGDRMARALHDDLAKRIARTDSTNETKLQELTAAQLVAMTRRRAGRETPEDARFKQITILDVYGGAATVKVEMADWIDYMHLARFGEEWKIVNVLWEQKPRKD